MKTAQHLENNVISYTEAASLYEFVNQWSQSYQNEMKKIPLFNTAKTQQWTQEQKSYFAKVFYHARGHFHDFLWYMGNIAPDKTSKNIILQNLSEEFGGSGRSHETLYFNFAKSLNLDLRDEFVKQTHYLNFVREFNYGHLQWLAEHDWDSCLSTFAAYEKLDNVDYQYLFLLAKNLGVEGDGLLFFAVHKQVQHFETTLEPLIRIWSSNRQKVEEAFDFISTHQLQMWQNLSQEIIAHGRAIPSHKK